MRLGRHSAENLVAVTDIQVFIVLAMIQIRPSLPARRRRHQSVRAVICHQQPVKLRGVVPSSGDDFSVRKYRASQSSTNDFNLANAWSHCSETISRYCLISCIGSGSNSNRCSRPARTPCTIPARCNTRRCLVIACRVSFEPTVNSEIECGCPLHNFAISNSRVSSPKAAKIAARPRSAAVTLLWLLCDMALDVLHLLCPASIVHAKRFHASAGGNLIETGFAQK